MILCEYVYVWMLISICFCSITYPVLSYSSMHSSISCIFNGNLSIFDHVKLKSAPRSPFESECIHLCSFTPLLVVSLVFCFCLCTPTSLCHLFFLCHCLRSLALFARRCRMIWQHRWRFNAWHKHSVIYFFRSNDENKDIDTIKY